MEIHSNSPKLYYGFKQNYMYERCSLKRRIYIANFAIFKIATFWSYHLHFLRKLAKFRETETSRVFGW